MPGMSGFSISSRRQRHCTQHVSPDLVGRHREAALSRRSKLRPGFGDRSASRKRHISAMRMADPSEKGVREA
jgi:hypothetical protein